MTNSQIFFEEFEEFKREVSKMTLPVMDELDRFLSETDNATLILLFNESSRGNGPGLYSYTDGHSSHIFLFISFGILVVASFMSNIFVCCVIIRNKKMHTVTNMFMLNMAVSDLILVLLNVPLNIARHIMDEWTLGRPLCHLLNYSLMASVYVYSFTLTAIALDRHRVLLYPLHPRITKKECMAVMFLIWTISFLLAIPYGIFTEVGYVDIVFTRIQRCKASYPSPSGTWEQYVTVFTINLQYILPLIIIGLAYCRVVHKLWIRTHLGVVTEVQRVIQINAKRRSIKLLIAVVVVFAICWMPLNLYHILTDFHPDTTVFYYSSTVFFICHWIAISSTCINSVLYCWMNPTFRSQLRPICCGGPPRNQFEQDYCDVYLQNVTSRQNVRYCTVNSTSSTDGQRAERMLTKKFSYKISFKSKVKYNETYL
ncbi:G-protein coupled receptor 83-like [Saccostrea echinata]|uniref:G-protein coupled receptor 83-like n=1 Tax=Saccostrea echinata TaxID=191078 RepID=UPI002A82F799|nr:G-protein coupled receptor 83-like [Saccostrea echinata]